MLFNKSIFAVAIVALANVVTATTVQTPACVLKIIGNQANPADSKTICGSSASKIQSDISKNCADSDASLKFFASNCAQLGHKVVTDVSTTTATSTGTSESSTATGFVTAVSSGSATHTGTSAVATGTGTSAAAGTSGVSTSTASGTGSAASPTFNAASSDRQFSATTFVAAVFLGAAALL
ncbi:hypothetical protein LT330_000943 [Penicillium expansum]|uniref:GPI anchored cell wall protein n=1 Tax=Penicillium expansum TaxID=27334 RepID=A0A0A2JCW4_PENEN|nr:hypothetical protein PEX2_058220 [Penicillium expansum]KAJ5501522.1 hypothetical protein N7453_006339 [Penicillium expansum]KAK4867433.1 hypothetical protein LT330_000943 [Penicillium expansum]KGO40057.1 hypothetical protein PEXP_034410 [Penicillium expansum]KGO53179.1 hypothetical protein PEX2_058220 [Penicillium expansum]KGO59291.1 hypothetical protein PEX1_094710 [Penicillium expansum]